MRYIIFQCPSLQFIDVSSFNNFDFYINLLSEIPNNATLKVHKNFVEKIKAMADNKNLSIIS